MSTPITFFPFPLLFFALCLATSHFIQQRAGTKLNPEEHVRIKAALSAPVRWLFIALGSLCAMFFILALWPDRPSWLFQGFLVTGFVAMAAFVLLGFYRLSHLRLLTTYIRQVWVGQIIYMLGILAMGYGAFSTFGSM